MTSPSNVVDNNAWKRRRELSDVDRKLADQARERIQPVLARLQAAGALTPDATRRVLLGLGYANTDIVVQPMRVPSWWTSPHPLVGAVYAVHIGQSACVIGDVRPERVVVEVAGSAVEYGCLEPFSH